MQTLRQWQSKCIERALDKYSAGDKHFFVVATPASGKTIMAAHVIKSLFMQDKIDYVLVLSPSINVSKSFSETISQIMGKPFDGKFGSIGQSLTYYSLGFLGEQFWTIFDNYRVLVICDEVHHCSASLISSFANMWGKQLRDTIQKKAAYTLSLSGTPWRSDQTPVALGEYCTNNIIKPDYIYGLKEAIHDNVCRQPKIIAIDSNEIIYSEGNKNKRYYKSIRALIENEEIPYQSLLENDEIINFMLQKSIDRLVDLRRDSPNAGGLIVASNVIHAQTIHHILVSKFRQSAEIVTYHSDNPEEVINTFKQSSTSWIVSVGMISEGTNIPRLQVCCYLSRIKTELYFRQVLGRILRVTPRQHPYSYLYILAEEKLIEFASRVDDDLPEYSVLIKASDQHKKTEESKINQPSNHSPLDNQACNDNVDNEEAISIPNRPVNDFEIDDKKTSFQGLYEEMLLLQE